MDLGLADKVALIAGGSSGIGLASARELAAEGAHIAICGRDPGRLAAAERSLKEAARGRVSTASVDISDAAAARRWIDETAADLGALHILLVSGGSPPVGPATAFGLGEYESAVGSVLFPPVGLALAALPHMRAARWGRLLFVASETASVPVPSLALSGIARAAIVRFAQAMAAELGRDGITVNVLAPALTRTPPIERAAERLAAQTPGSDAEAQLRAMGQHNAIGRIARPEEVAAVAVFLASERASFVTGGVHLIDGGSGVLGPEMPQVTGTAKDTYT